MAAAFEAVDVESTPSFTDTAGHWAERYIKDATSKGIVNGYPDGTLER
jgi:S-layer homology domain